LAVSWTRKNDLDIFNKILPQLILQEIPYMYYK